MLIPTTDEGFKSSSLSNYTRELVQNINDYYKKYDWYQAIYQNQGKNQENSFVIKCNKEIDPTQYPDHFGKHRVFYYWEGKKKLTIHEAALKFHEEYYKTTWFGGKFFATLKY